MRVGDLLKQLDGMPPDMPVCVAEIDEAFAINAASVEVVERARVQDQKASGREAVELSNGSDRIVVIRW